MIEDMLTTSSSLPWKAWVRQVEEIGEGYLGIDSEDVIYRNIEL